MFALVLNRTNEWMTPEPVGCTWLVSNSAPPIEALLPAVVRSETNSALARDAPNTTAPAASASAQTALRTCLRMGTLSFKGQFLGLRAARLKLKAQRSHSLR